MKLVFLFLIVTSFLFVTYAETAVTDATDKGLLIGAITTLFGMIVVGVRVGFQWITTQFEDMKAKLNEMEDKIDQERESSDKRIDGLFNSFLQKLETRIETKVTEKISRGEVTRSTTP